MRFFTFGFIVTLLSSLILAVGGNLQVPAQYKFSLGVTYSCDTNEIIVTVSNIEGTSGPDGFDITVLKDTISLNSGKTNTNGTIKFKITDNGRYIVRGKKDTYFEQTTIIDVNACQAKEPEFLCSDSNDMQERVRCVIHLPDDYINKVRYVPEECRVKSNEPEKIRCIQTYRLLQTCRGEGTTDAQREYCIKPKLNLSDSISDDIAKCNSKLGAEKRLCLQTLKENVFTLVKFRIYNLIYKAYILKERGANENDVVNFMVFINQKKIEFNNAQNIDDKIKVVQKIKIQWNDFKENIKKQLEAKSK